MTEIIKNKALLKEIEIKKRSMCFKAKKLGLSHPAVVRCSQELDALLNQYQKNLG